MANKVGANVGLAEEQFFSLDKSFYDNYPKEYFLNKLDDILVRLTQSEKYLSAFTGTTLELGRLSGTYTQDENTQLIKNAKIELYETYMHCLESFFRLFIIRASQHKCDWLAMADFATTAYHRAIKQVLSKEYSSINNNLSWDLTVQYAFTGMSSTGVVEQEAIDNWKSWVSFCAHELSEVRAYNAYKHGLTIHSYEGAFSIQPEDSDEEYGRSGDMISYLTKKEKDTRFKWTKKSIFVDLDDLGYKVQIFGLLIYNMVSAGQMQHGGERIELHYPSQEITPYLSQKDLGDDIQSLFQCVTSLSTDLLYYNDTSNTQEE